ncbi:rhodoquinone biosynthesis methyltransferase RquA [Hoeflea sp.]|uniref:rhodoquinone biosynthesis methyltransferase RquA n=1 Tax=Hoeflea sp. TaxID=1940281 RepID=UPI0019A32292|nr:rhodoquinone biosynthesis methyltransferase RquA [Hoeflea sp.]MBC7284016.1 methyltransferase domain-containing protein [Hoeflea sp.]
MLQIPDKLRFKPASHAIPSYLRATYEWAYLNPRNVRWLDNETIVGVILFGNHVRLRNAALAEIRTGQNVLQVAHVYGTLIPEIARRVGPTGSLEAIDVAPLQAALCRRKLWGMRHTDVRISDASDPGDGGYDVVNCYFLLHEVPDDMKRAIVTALLQRVAPGGRAVFVDYHRPARLHPLRGLYRKLFERLEPFALSMWDHEVRDLGADAAAFEWTKEIFFGGVFQKTVAHRRGSI